MRLRHRRRRVRSSKYGGGGGGGGGGGAAAWKIDVEAREKSGREKGWNPAAALMGHSTLL